MEEDVGCRCAFNENHECGGDDDGDEGDDDDDDDDDDDVNDEDCVDAIIGANIVLLLAIYPLDAAANLARDQVHFNSK